MGQQQYELEYILDAKFSNQSNRYYYLVKWVNWKLQDSTWQPEQNLEHAQQALEEFNRKRKNNQALFDWQKYQNLRSFWEDDEQQLKKPNKKPKKRGRPKKIEKQRQKQERKIKQVRGRRTVKQFQKVYDQLLSDVEDISSCTNQNRQSAHKTNNSSNINAKNELNQNLNNNQNSGKNDIEDNSSQLQDLDSLSVRKKFKQRSAMMESYESQGQFSDSINMKNEIVKEYEENDNGYLNQKQEKQLNSIKSKQNQFSYKYDSVGMEWQERERQISKNQIMKLNDSKRVHESIEKGRNIIQLADQFSMENQNQNANEGIQFDINQESGVQVGKNRSVFIENMNKNDDDEDQQQLIRCQEGLFDDLIKNNDQINRNICPKPLTTPQKPNLKSECITGHSCPFSSSKKEQQKQTQTEEMQKYKVIGLKRINKKYMLYDVLDRETGLKQWMGEKQMLKLCPIAGFQYLKSRMVFEVPGQYAQLFKGLSK